MNIYPRAFTVPSQPVLPTALSFEKQVAPPQGRARRTLAGLRSGMLVAALAMTAMLFPARGLAATTPSNVFSAPVPVGQTVTQPFSVTIQHPGTGVIGSIAVLTQGVQNLDFTQSSGCSMIGIYPQGSTCQVNVSFTPKYPGTRLGGIVVKDTLGSVMATQVIAGTGVGPLSVFEAGQITTVVGNGHLLDDNIPTQIGAGTAINQPLGVATDGNGDLYYSDSGKYIIRKLTNSTGLVTTVAGTGQPGYSPSGTPGLSAQLSVPEGLAIDGVGNVFFADSGNHVIREILASDGTVVTVAGIGGSAGSSGDGGAATSATLSSPSGVALDLAGNLYIADQGNNKIREVFASDGTISTIAGNGTKGFSGDGGPATAAELSVPWGVMVAPDGTIYISDLHNNKIRMIDPATQVISTLLGDQPNYTGDGGAASQATLNSPAATVLDAAGDLFIADSENGTVRKINGTTHIITTIAGDGTAGTTGDQLNGDNMYVEMNKPYALALDGAGSLYIADRIGLRIRKVNATVGGLHFEDIKVTNTSPVQQQVMENDGNATLNLTSLVPDVNSVVDPVTTTCVAGLAMPVGSTCTIGAEFKPSVTGQPLVGVILVNSDSATTATQVDLSGNSLPIFPTSTAITGTPNPAAFGAAVTFTATVSSDNTNAMSGTVKFLDYGVQVGPDQILNSTTRTAIFTTASLALGTHQITAVYAGDDGDATSTSPTAFVEVVKQATSFIITSNSNPSSVYQNVTFTATLTPTNNPSTAPTGNVVFSSDGNLLPNGTVALVNGSASVSSALLAQGTHTITATYAGDTVNLANVSNNYVQTVNLASTTTMLASSNSSVSVTTPVTFRATVTGVPASTPTGTVIFKDNNTAMGNGTVDTSGVATFTTSSLTTGLHTITAVYQGDTDYDISTSSPLNESIQQIGTTTSLTASANPAVSGASVNFTIRVVAASNTNPNLPVTGTVTLTENGTPLGTATLSAASSNPAVGTAVVTVASFGTGAHALTAVYSGDTNYTTSTAPSTLQTTSATTTTQLTASATSVIATKSVSLTASVTSQGGGLPTGHVTFTDNGTPLSSATLNAAGLAGIETSSLSVGTHTIVATYGADSNDSASTSNAVTITVQSANTTVGLTPSQNPTNFGQPLTIAVNVTGNGSLPTGSVTFFDGTAALGTYPLTNGSATYSTSTLTDGKHAITASYGGDATNLASASTVLNELVLQTITLSLTSNSPNPSVARSNVHLIATILPQQGIQPTGAVMFKDGSAVLGTGAINGTTATFDTAALAVGTHQITAYYAGDGVSQSLTSAAYPQIVNAAGTTITVTSSTNPSTFGTALTLTATASSAAGSLSGTVVFEDSGVSIGQATLSGGVASFTTSALTPGVHSIVAAYQGDSNDAPASSAALSEVVKRATSVTITSSQNPMLTLAPVVISATVANGGTSPATGTIVFTEDGNQVGTSEMTGGVATLSLNNLPAGSHIFQVSYSGDSVDLASSSSVFTETVQLRATTDTVSSVASSLSGGQQLTLTSVVRWTGDVTPTGTVTFYNGQTKLGTAALDGTGIGSLTVLLNVTTANISSTYSGDASYAGSSSAVDTVAVGPAPNFTMTADPSTFSVQKGQHTTIKLQMASVKGFTDSFSLGCLGLPFATTCTFAQDKMTLAANGAQTVVITVDTGNPLLGGTQAKNEGMTRSSIMACALPGGLLLMMLVLPRKRLRSLRGLVLVLLMAAIAGGLTGCGGLTQSSTPVGSYSFQINAQGVTGVSQTVTMTMNVTQ